MNILLVAPYFYPEEGGLGRYAYHISRRLVERGHKITVLCSTKRGKDKVEDIDGVKVIRQKPHFIVSNTPIKLDLLFIMSKMVKKYNFDLINAHTPVPYYAEVASWVSTIHKIALIVTCHSPFRGNTLFLDFIAWVIRHTFEKVLFQVAKRIIANSEFTSNNYLRRFSKKSTIITPGVELSEFTYLHSHHRGKNILFIGPLTREREYKGLNHLLRAVSIVKETISDISLTIVGQGELLARYKFLCREIGIEENVNFVGKLSQSKLINEYHKTDVLVLPSISNGEGFGMVLIEANACGKPVIGTKIGGIPCFIKDGINGLLVPPRDPVALAGAIKKILGDKKLAEDIGSFGRRYVERNFDWNDLVVKTEKIFYVAVK